MSAKEEARAGAVEGAELEAQSNQLLAGGVALGTFAVATTLLVGATCPLCIVAAPAMIGAAVLQRWRGARARARDEDDALREPDDAPREPEGET